MSTPMESAVARLEQAKKQTFDALEHVQVVEDWLYQMSESYETAGFGQSTSAMNNAVVFHTLSRAHLALHQALAPLAEALIGLGDLQ